MVTALPCELEEEIEEGPMHSDYALSTIWNHIPANMPEYVRKGPKSDALALMQEKRNEVD